MAITSANTLFLCKEALRRLLVVCSNTAVWEFDGILWTDRTGNPVDDGFLLRWTGGWLTGALTLANRAVVRTFKPGVDATTQPMKYNGGAGQPGDQTWESQNYSARVFRPYREYMIAGYPDWDGTPYPSRIQWSHAVQPGQVPEDWVPRDDNDAGDRDLADTPGAVVDMAPLRDSLLIFKEDAIYTMNWIPGNEVFDTRRITTNRGIYTQDVAVEFNGYVWAQGIEDIFVIDGNTANSIIWGRIKRTWLADRDPDRAQYAFTTLDPVNEEMLFFYVSRNASPQVIYPDKALVLSLKNNAFFFRDYGLEIPHARNMLSVFDQVSADLVFYGIDSLGGRLLDLESAPDRLGAAVPAYFTRSALFADPGHDWIQVDTAKLQISGSKASLQLGGQPALDAPIDWRGAIETDPTTDYKIDVRHNANLVAVRVDVSTLTDWRIGNLNLLVEKAGER